MRRLWRGSSRHMPTGSTGSAMNPVRPASARRSPWGLTVRSSRAGKRLRHTYATRLRQGGADVAQVQALLGHASLETSARYFRAGTAETAAIVDAIFDA